LASGPVNVLVPGVPPYAGGITFTADPGVQLGVGVGVIVGVGVGVTVGVGVGVTVGVGVGMSLSVIVTVADDGEPIVAPPMAFDKLTVNSSDGSTKASSQIVTSNDSLASPLAKLSVPEAVM
jgi:hypothetical protein